MHVWLPNVYARMNAGGKEDLNVLLSSSFLLQFFNGY